MAARFMSHLLSLPLVAIVGPTASGKTALAITMAERFNGEIICADSRTVYREMNIGTAKPTIEDQERVPHWGLNLVEPGEHFSAADFKDYALQKIKEIRSRGHIPFLVGGTGLYVDAVLFDYQFGPRADAHIREGLEAMTLEKLIQYCYKNNIDLPENIKNKRYIIRAIEQGSINNKRRSNPIDNTVIVGIATDRDDLRAKIGARIEQLLNDGVVEEATNLGKKYGWGNAAMTGNIYPLVHDYLERHITLEEMKEKVTTLDWRLAKRQLTWLQRDPYIYWGDLEKVQSYLVQILANE
jgi:tRNA dimethylallyltransferase